MNISDLIKNDLNTTNTNKKQSKESTNSIEEQIAYQNEILQSIDNNVDSIKFWVSIIGFFYLCKILIIVTGIVLTIQMGHKFSEIITSYVNTFLN